LLVLGLVTEGRGVRYSLKHPPVPGFVLGFLALGILGSLGVCRARRARRSPPPASFS